MEKLDLKKVHRDLYRPPTKEVSLVDVPEFGFIQVDGEIPPGIPVDQAPEYHQSLELLYGLAYGLKFMSKLSEKNPLDFTVMPLEGLWWTERSHEGFDFSRDQTWFFTSMIMQPDHITQDMFERALDEFKSKKDNPLVERARLARFEERLSMQVMHIGPFSEEAATLAKMDTFAAEHGYVHRGRHHEIYLGDPRRTKPENLKTILRHPIERV